MSTSPGLPSLQSLFEHAACGLLLARPDGTIAVVNQTFCDWLGYEQADLEGRRRVQDLLTMGSRIFHQTHWMPLLSMQGAIAELKVDFVDRDGVRTIPMLVNVVRRRHGDVVFDELSAMVVLDRHKYERELLLARRHAETALAERHEIERALHVNRDALRQLNEQLGDADRKKDEFLATLAHELRNPLAPMHNVLEILLHKDLQDPQLCWAREVLQRQLGHMGRLVDDLLEVSRITQGKLELRLQLLDVVVVVQAALEEVRPALLAAQHRLDITLPQEPTWLHADPVRLTQVLVNLLGNAVKYTPHGGHIALACQRAGAELVITVADNGIGIAPDHLAHVFEMFSQLESGLQRSQGGLGIGLALVRGLAALHGGTIAVSSPGLGQGSEFTVRLPLAHAGQTAPQAQATIPVAAAARRVLVVDDNQDAAHSLALLLELEGHAVAVAFDGEAALNQAARWQPDVVLLDIGLPGISGYEVAQRLRQMPGGQRLRLVALTGWSHEQDRHAALQAGFDHHLTKPVEPQTLRAVLADGVMPPGQ
ncbi:hybrid sensor histidine kinase/response regulator [Azohydromonas australica]|uniref:hybrid sensor histidine kinase/response regulator n=1 Tax=Azohydromonas australica TaxID=364039 RepID=UPI000427A226|nr:ATP-binding protein [Azohydromonas australica]